MIEKKIAASLILIIIFGGVFLFSRNKSSPSENNFLNIKAEVDQKNFDWGDIPLNGGNVTKIFTIKNVGSDILKISNIKTSCTCTQAQIVIDGQKSPDFSMHSASAWVGEMAPGKQAQLAIFFDPAFHGPTGVGPIERLVSLETNDPNNSRLEFSLTANVSK